ncbi:MAG TPA: molybdopterin-dependent oxidoreductase [Ktedonobacterales bacterium]|nr:molybdopterin-dependent oxidoreductase [Ktedonobacterales bacterium]
MPPRLTDWSLALAGALAFVSGIVSLDSGAPAQWTIFALHGAAGLWLLLLLRGKLVRVWPRLIHPRRWDRRTPLGLLATLAVLLALGSGIVWVTGAGGDFALAGFNLLNWHILLGFILTLFIALHMVARARPLRQRDVHGRRQALRFGALLLAAGAIWPAQQTFQRLLALPGARRRFTGSYEANSYAGNIFPATSWVADNPHPLDPATWRLTIGGAVAHPLTLSLDDITAAGDALDATLDCTGGFYSSQRWGGIRVGRILDSAAPHPTAAWVSFVSVTGYRWALPLTEARAALLAATVGDEPLAHAHGAPLRLVAPNRRGFQWVKWLVRLDIRAEPDPGELIAIHTSGFTPVGRGD